MNIYIKNKKKPKAIISSSKIKNETVKESRGYLSPQWGIIDKVYSEDNTADVILRNGLLLRRVTIPSKEWAGYNDNYPIGKQDLPPENTKTEVLIIFPDNKIEEAVIIGSRFEILGDAGISQKTEFLKSGQERKITTINEYGWKTVYDKDTGDYTITNEKDSDFLIEIDETGKTITIKDWNQNYLKWTGSTLELNGKTKDFVTHAELTSAISTFITALNSHTHLGVTTGGGTSGIPAGSMSLDISSAKALKVKTG